MARLTERLRGAAIPAAVSLAAALVVANFAALLIGEETPWLPALDFFLDLVVIGAALWFIVWQSLRAEAATASMQARIDDVQARLAAVVDSAMDAIVTADESYTVVLYNRAAETMFGWRREEALGAPLDRLIPARFRDRHRRDVEQFGRTGITSRRMGDGTTLAGLRADGSEFPIEASISQVQAGGRRYFTVILRDVTRRKQAEDALLRQQDELRELSARVLEAREEEKTRIARELHDELGQLLTALKIDLGWLRERLTGLPAEVANKAAGMEALLDRTVGSVRRISADLRPLMLDDLGLADAAEWLVEDFAGRAGIQCRMENADPADLARLDRGAATTLYRALQESLTNVARHSGASNAWVTLRAEAARVWLEVEDNGRGIDDAALGKPRSLGLKGMRERVAYLGGKFEVTRAARGGTRVRIELPLPEARAGAP